MLILVVGASLIFDYINGFHDTANAIATCVSTRALSIRAAIVMAAGLNFVGAMISTKVAATIGKGIVDANNVTQMVVLAGVAGAIIWNLITWYYGLPSSSSHAIIGGIMGAVTAHAGVAALHWAGLKKIILALVLSPIVGTVLGFVFMVLMMWGFRNSAPHALNKGFRRLQVLSAAFMAFSHGTADAQKSMGVITMALVSYGYLKSFEVPPWVMIACATAMAFGTAAAAGAWLLRRNGFRRGHPRGIGLRDADQHHSCDNIGYPGGRAVEADVGGKLGDRLPDRLGLGVDHSRLGAGGVCHLYGAESVPGKIIKRLTTKDLRSFETSEVFLLLRESSLYSSSSPTSSISLVISARASSCRRNLTTRK